MISPSSAPAEPENPSEKSATPIPEGFLLPRHLPLEVDLGCHRGAYLVEMATRYPDVRWLGIERQRHRVERCLAKIQRLGLANAWVLQGEGIEPLRNHPDLGPVSRLHISFPDPWPKRRHHVRRMVNTAFLREVVEHLTPTGEIRLMTDDAPYFRAMRDAFDPLLGECEIIPWDTTFRDEAETEFQKKFAERGMRPFTLALRRRAS